MPESRRHRKLKSKDAHITGSTEHVLPSGKRLDVRTRTGIGVEIERSGRAGIRKSVATLREAVDTGNIRKARLRVPHRDLDFAYEEMRRQRLGGELTNLGGTTKVNVPKRRK
jgi:hypothetical protein